MVFDEPMRSPSAGSMAPASSMMPAVLAAIDEVAGVVQIVLGSAQIDQAARRYAQSSLIALAPV